MITEQLISHEELLDAVQDASLRYVEADKALEDYRLNGSPENTPKFTQLKREVTNSAQALRDVQAQLVLAGPLYY